MDQLFYSPSTKGFYSQDIHGDNRPADCVAITKELHTELIATQAQGNTIDFDAETNLPCAVPPPPLTPEQRARIGEAAIQNLLDTTAQSHGYDDIFTAVSYAAMPEGTPFREESIAFGVWRANCWKTGHDILNAVLAGTLEEPTTEELLAEMPELALPSAG